MSGKLIVSNQVKCNSCGDEPFSGSVHDFRSCKCGAIAVDGGPYYLRRVGDIHNYTEMSMEFSQKAIDACIEAVKWGQETGRNERGIVYAVMRALRDNGIEMKEKNNDR